MGLHRGSGDGVDDGLLILELLDVSHQGNHDLGNNLQPFLVQPAGRLDDGASLHLGDLRVRDAEPHAPMTEHRVEFVELLHPPEQAPLRIQLGAALAGRFERRNLHHELFAPGEELVKGWIDRPDRDRRAAHGLEDAVEVFALQR